MRNKSCLQTLFFLLVLPFTSAVRAADIDYLGLESLFGEPVTAIATGKPLRMSDAPLSVEIISHKEIARSGAMDIPQLLRRVAGVDVSRNFKGQVDVNIRGYNQPLSNRLLVLINGRQVYMDNLGFTMWNALPVQMGEIKQIEIVKGPNTSLLGFNAVSGAINIITFDPLTMDRDALELRAGTQNHREGAGIITVSPTDNMALRLSAGTVQSDGFERDVYGPEVTEDDALDRTNANLTWSYRYSDNLGFEAEAGYADQVADTMFAAGGNGIFDLENDHIRLAAHYDSEWLGLVSANIYRNQSEFFVDFRKFNSTLDPTSVIENELNVFQLNTLKPLGTDHNVRLGMEVRENSLQGSSIGTDPGRFNNDIVSVNAMWDWQVQDKLQLTNALRHDDWETSRDGGIPLNDTKLDIELSDYDRSESDISYNSSLVYRATAQASVRLSVGKGIHVPSLAELSRSFVPAPVIENYGNPFLETEENTTTELAFNYRFSGSDTRLTVNLFRQELENFIGQTVVPPGPGNARADITFENLGESTAQGFETTLKGSRDDSLQWNINYSYINIDDSSDENAVRDILFETNTPQHKLNIYAGYTLGKWLVDLDMHYVHDIEYQAAIINFSNPLVKETLDSYLLLNLNVTYQLFKHTQVAIHGYNLIDDHQERPDFMVGPSAAGGEELQRAFFLTLRYQPEG